MKSKSYPCVSVSATVAAILAGAAMASYTQTARSAEEAVDEIEEVTVTGSRISRRDYETNSPLVTVTAENLENRTGLNIESYLNQMPNFNPASTPVTTQFDVQITPVNTPGIATVSLRGFGPNRNLVLVDGKRPVPSNALMVTDLNSIPSYLVERLEIISGGASAVYGADAIGGVTNFILKDNFEGVEVDAQYGITEAGDGQEYRAYAVMGTNFADGRGNVTIGAEYYNRDAAYEKNRDFYTDSWSDPYVGGDFFVFGYNGYNVAFSFNGPSEAAVNNLFQNRPTYPAGSGPGAGLRTGVYGAGTAPFRIFQGFRFNANGTVMALAGNNIYPVDPTQSKYLANGGQLDQYEYALQRMYDGTLVNSSGQAVVGQEMYGLKWNYVEAYASAPQERYSIYASGNYDINDAITFYARGTFAESKTRTRLFPANASYGWEANIGYNPTTDSPLLPTLNWSDPAVVSAALANPTAAAYRNPNFIAHGAAGAQHPVTPEVSVLLNSRPNPAGNWVMETYPIDSFDARATLNTNEVYQIDAGIRFDLPFGDWNGDAYVSHGESSSYANAFGNNSLTRWRLMVAQPDWGRNASLESNQPNTSPPQTPPASLGFGGAQVHCTSGFYEMIFMGDTRPSEDCRAAVIANLQTRTQNQQTVVEASTQGGLFNLPGGQVRAALGIQYRQNESQFIPDILQSTSSFADQVIGVYPTGYLDAETSVVDYYGELLVPILQDLPFAQRVELNLGGRYSDYEDTDSTFTYKAELSWQFNDWLRARTSFNHATRAPNLGELFLNVQEIFTIGGNFGDPCGLRSNAPYGAGGANAPGTSTKMLDPVITPPETNPPPLAPGQTQAGSDSAMRICQAMMGTTGTTAFYAGNQAAPPPGGGFAWVLQQGNPELESEEADTWTVGLVFASQSANPWFSGMSASIDWWKVDIENAIQQYSTDYASWRCYGAVTVTSAAEAAAQAATRACRNVERNQSNGNQINTLLEYDNQATIATSGIDLQFNWFSQFGDVGFDGIPGGLGLNVQAGWTDYYKTKQSPLPFDVETDWAGSLGPTLTGTNPGAYDYRIFTTLNYVLDNFSVSLRWNHLPSVWGANKASENAIIKNNQSVAAGGEGILLSYTPTTAIKVGSYDNFALSFNWDVNDTLSVRAGVDNLFDVSPELTAKAAGRPYDASLTLAQNNANLAAVCQGAPGCVNPLGYSLPSSSAGLTSAGFYDTVGRRFYVGLKARF